MTNDEILRRAHEDGLWDELLKLAVPIPMIGAEDTAAFVDRLLIERAKRRDALGVDGDDQKKSGLAGQIEAAQRSVAIWPQWMRDAARFGKKDELAELRARNAELEAQIEACRPHMIGEYDTPAECIRDLIGVLDNYKSEHAALESEFTALLERKPNYKAVGKALSDWNGSGLPSPTLARKIADAAFEKMPND